MGTELRGKAVADSITEDLIKRTESLKEGGVHPKLSIIRIGTRADDLSYENGAKKRAERIGILVETHELPEDSGKETVLSIIQKLNQDDSVHGILLFCPLPDHLRADEQWIRDSILPEKDMDCLTTLSSSGVYLGRNTGYPPCTPQACIELLKYYGIKLCGKKVTVLGRSSVVGKPLSMMLLNENATVTICHSKTRNIEEQARNADILVSCMGRLHSVGAAFVRAGQTVLDVGINYDPATGKISGDVDTEAVTGIVDGITPVPGGIGSITSAVLMKHVVLAAEKKAGMLYSVW